MKVGENGSRPIECGAKSIPSSARFVSESVWFDFIGSQYHLVFCFHVEAIRIHEKIVLRVLYAAAYGFIRAAAACTVGG
jgi:hypothetical protein